MRGLRAAVRLLTRIPIGSAGPDQLDTSGSIGWLPIVGGMIGLVVAGGYGLLAEVLPELAAATLAVTLGIVVTGALHEDGLADTIDAFGAGGGPEETLRILKDPAHGTYGVIALVLSIVLRVLSLAALPVTIALLALPAVHALGRGGAVGLIGSMPPATGDGLGAAHSRSGSSAGILGGLLSAIAIGVTLLGWWGAVFAALAGVATLMVGMLAMRRISGFTGDILGATEQTIEIVLLLVAAALASSGLLVAPWWSS
ncbi:MAG TPA: adenosylcobinamide-GDP ribazoletransferase [Acidimicrobiia bacterium]|nr:adenosylcobinamide-GDP ribazoletransferase [Acidimicrobiia bacterium]